MNPVLVALAFSVPSGSSDNEKMKRIIWCPTGPFSFLPIHAAGIYGTSQAGTKLSDFAISSYIPILGALVPSGGKDGKQPSSNIHIVTVPQPPDDGQFKLSGVKEEIDYIQTLSAKSPLVNLQHSRGTVEDVMAKMMNADWVHFACHGVQDPKSPLDSGLCLADRRRLKLSDIIRLSRPQGGLAFLSACQTAQGDEKLSEESVHLAAGMLLAGYGSVIATMWSIMDRDAPRVTKDVYEHLFRDDGKIPDSSEAAEALHRAVLGLRDSGATFSSWVPFIHVGR